LKKHMPNILQSLQINTLISYFISPKFGGWLLILKISFIVFSLFLLGFIIFALIKTTWLKRLIIYDLQEFLTYRPYGSRKSEKDWQKIKNRLETDMESEYKLAVIEADSIFNEILKRMGFGGESLGERLEKLTVASLPNINEAREAHKIRNNIIHDPTYKLTLDEAKKIIIIYEKSLTDLQAL